MFKYHGYSSDCPRPFLKPPPEKQLTYAEMKAERDQLRSACEMLAGALDFCWEHAFNATQTAWDDKREIVRGLNQEIKDKAKEALANYERIKRQLAGEK